LTVRDRAVIVPDVGGDNEELLRCYLALVREARGLRPTDRFALRQDDVEALAAMLDLDDDGLEKRLMRLLNVGATEAAEMRRRLVARRILGAAGALTIGLIASMPLTAAASDLPAPTPATAFVAGATMSAGASMIDIGEPLVIERAPADIPPPTTTTPAPAPDEHDEIIDPLTIERDPDTTTPPPPPADEHVEIGDALVIERDNPNP
jgi:hypothetical protein